MAIRSDNDPSSAAPPSGIESGDLEQYGVWVKADSQELQDSQVSHSYCPACAEIASQEIKALLASSPATPTA
jgi:hypothetical protein